MKIVSTGLAVMVLAGLGWAAPTQAQGLPQGTYLDSCTGAHVEGDTLVAHCRTPDGREERSALAGFHRCIGDIGNRNGSLQCDFGRAEAAPVGPREPNYAENDRCVRLHQEAEDLRTRIDHEFNPLERAHLEERLREVHDQEGHC